MDPHIGMRQVKQEERRLYVKLGLARDASD
jgi:hypothetical protein